MSTTRANVDLGASLAVAKDLAKAHHTTLTEILRRAVSVYRVLSREIDAGNTIQISDGKNVRELLIVIR